MKYCSDCNKKKLSNKGKYCKDCGYKNRVRPSGMKYKKHKENPSSFKKGSMPWNKGKKIKKTKKYSKGYDAIHEWVERWIKDPLKCETCGSTKNLEWSNKSGKYLRKKSDWQKLCKKCHHRYDYQKFGKRKAFFR